MTPSTSISPVHSPLSPSSCAECRFWDHKREKDGLCRRSAPAPCTRENEIARWRQTHAEDWCGEGQRNTVLASVACGSCRFWFRPANGIDPLALSGRFSDWWRGAGLCRRYAPKTDAELGGRSFWRVTHKTDLCADSEAPS